MKKLALSFGIILLALSSVLAQNTTQKKLSYDRPVTSCEEQWIVCPQGADSAYQFGFVFDQGNGLTFRLEGAFEIDKNGDYVLLPKKKVNQHANLGGSSDLVALIPANKYNQLKIGIFPSWYDIQSKKGENVFKLYTEGYVANARGEYDKALIQLHKAYLLNPDYKNLRYQFAVALNAKELYAKADTVLRQAMRTDRKSYKLYEELSFAQLQQRKVKQAVRTAKKGISLCKLNPPRAKMAIRLCIHFYHKKDKENFKIWMKESRKYTVDGSMQALQIHDMLKKSKKWPKKKK